MAASAHKGNALFRNINLDQFPGAMRATPVPLSLFHTTLSATFTADAGTDICTLGSGATPSTGVAVVLTTTTTLPAGLAVSTIYFIINVTSTTFKLATTVANANAGTAINITDAGTGTHTVATINPGIIQHYVIDPRTDEYFWHDSNGRVWYGTSSGNIRLLKNGAIDTGGSITQGVGQGLAILGTSDGTATYLFAFRNALLDVINVFGTANKETPVWSNSWQSLNSAAGSGNSHHAIYGQDNIIYFCDGRYVGSIKENSGSVFDPATGGTYTFNNQALDLPQYEVANWIEEHSTNLLIAGDSFDKVYPWDRISDSFNTPLISPERQVLRLKNIGNVTYIASGTRGNVYSTQGTYVTFFAKIPEQVSNNSGAVQSNIITWGGIGAINGNLIIGANVQTSGNDATYMFTPEGRVTIDRVTTTGSYPTCVAPNVAGEFYYMGYSAGLDFIDTNLYSSGLSCVANSALYRVGTKTDKGNLSTLEVQLAKPAASGSIRIGYRADTSSSFTTISTFTPDGATTSFKNDQIGLMDLENLQLECAFHGVVEITEITLIP